MVLKSFSNHKGTRFLTKNSDRCCRGTFAAGMGIACIRLQPAASLESVEKLMKTKVTKSQQFAGYGAVFATTVMWATSGIFIKLILTSAEISEYTLAFYRDSATFFCLLIILLIFRRPLLKVERRDIPWLAALGGLGLGIFHLLWNFGVGINGVAVSTVQQAIMPIILAVAARLIFKEAFDTRKIIAVALTLSGAFFISGLLRGGGEEINVAGVLVGFAIPVTYAMFNLFGKRITGKYHPFTILTYGFGFGALILLPIQFFVPAPLSFPPVSFLWLGGLVIISTLLPFALYTATLRKIQVSVAGLLSMAEIPIAFLYAYILFREMFSFYQWIGTALIVGGISLFVVLNRRRGAPKGSAEMHKPGKKARPGSAGDFTPPV